MPEGESQQNGLMQFVKKALGNLSSAQEARRQPIDQEQLLKNILNHTVFTEIPSYWSGIPADRQRCGEKEFNKLFLLIHERVSQRAAYSFANMVLDMPSLAPSNVIRASLSLARNNFIYDPEFSASILEGNTDIRPVKLDEAVAVEDGVAEGFFGRIAASSPDLADQTRIIKNEFKYLLGNALDPILKSREIISGSNDNKSMTITK